MADRIFIKMHKLESPWTFYYYQRPPLNDPQISYEESIHKIGKFSTVEEFWSYYSHIEQPSKIASTLALHLFRNDSRAMWEDEENSNGGFFLIRFPKGNTNYIWEILVLNLIGEQFPPDVVGVVISKRPKFDMIHLWHQTSSDENLKLEIATILWKMLQLPQKMQIDYYPFQNVLTNKSNHEGTKYIINKNGPVMHKTSE